MSDEAPAAVPKRLRLDWAEVRGRIKELVVVFLGVYAAFLLNRCEGDRRDAQRRGQILDALEREVSANVDELKPALAAGQVQVEGFDRKLAAGEMPPLGISHNNSSYSARDDATLLGSGGVEVLDVQTLEALRKVNALRRSFAASMQNQYQLELMTLGPHENAEFYDPDTKQLKGHYAWYPNVLHGLVADARTLLAGEEELLATIRSKQNKH